MTWTDDRVKQLVQLWTEGKSASQISQELGIVSRNAVIGKIHRLGIATRSTLGERPRLTKSVDVLLPSLMRRRPEKKETKPKPVPSLAPRTAPRSPSETTRLRTASSLPSLSALSPLANENLRVTPIFTPAKPISSILELTDRTCKWPIGDPGTSEFHFCGCETDTGSPYCRHHASMAYHVLKGRDKDKRPSTTLGKQIVYS